MKGVDTNIVARFLVGDDTGQAKKFYRMFKKAEAEKKRIVRAFSGYTRMNLGFGICLYDIKV